MRRPCLLLLSMLSPLVGLGCGGDSSGSALAGAGNGSASSTLTGTWDFQGTHGTKMTAGTIAVDAGAVTIVANGGTFSLSRSGDALTVSYSDDGGTRSGQGQQMGQGAAQFGALPFDLSGSTSFTETPLDPLATVGTCVGTLSQTALTAACQDVGRPPRPAPRHLNGMLTATRAASMESIFGDLGGVWSGTSSGGDSCTVMVQGSGISTSCTGGGSLTGSVTMVFSGATVSGTTSTGIEFSAQRR